MNDVTLADVARRAGVSVATVSRVLHNNGYVSEETRERVETALRDSGYRLNAVAQGLRRRRTVTLGLIVHGGLSNPFYAEVAMGAEHAASELGFNMLLSNARGDADHERRSVETLLSRRVDGILFTTALAAENVRLAIDAGVPAVEMERRLWEQAGLVAVDGYEGARLAVQHLLDLGHRNIGYIGEPFLDSEDDTETPITLIPRARFRAYRDTLHAAGLEVDLRNVISAEYPRGEEGWGHVAAGAKYMRSLLAQASDLTAVFAISDILAAGALQTLYIDGIQVPADVSVVGFDDTFAAYLAPALTTVVQPMFEMGFKAASLAIDMINTPSQPAVTVYCQTRLVRRESSAAPRTLRRRGLAATARRIAID